MVLLVGMVGGLACAAAHDEGHGGELLIGGLILGGLTAIVGWWIWAMLTYFIGTRVFGGTATPGEMLRVLGFSQAPGLITVFAFVPLLHWPLHAIAWIWILIAGVIAIRQALDFSTEKAIFTVLIGWLVPAILWFLVISFFLVAIVALVVGAAAVGSAAH